MKTRILYFLFLCPLLSGCVANEQTGEMEPGWFFWVFLGIFMGLLFIGALVNMLRKKKPDGTLSKAEQEMEAYEETLNKKLEEEAEAEKSEEEKEESETKMSDEEKTDSKEEKKEE